MSISSAEVTPMSTEQEYSDDPVDTALRVEEFTIQTAAYEAGSNYYCTPTTVIQVVKGSGEDEHVLREKRIAHLGIGPWVGLPEWRIKRARHRAARLVTRLSQQEVYAGSSE